MRLPALRRQLDGQAVGAAMYDLVCELYPFCRSITGEGLRQTLAALAARVPLTIHEVPTGTEVLDWTVPKEWTIRDAYIRRPGGERLVDFREHNLHVMSYSTAVDATVSLEELRGHLFSLPEHPDWIPYRTSYYARRWGFCLSHRQLSELDDGDYEVRIDADLAPGHLSYGEYLIPGEREEEVLITAHACHPSLANDNLSGLALVTLLAQHLTGLELRYSYRFLLMPGTIGSITWLSRNEAAVGRIAHGLVAACVGDPGGLTYKRSRRGDAEVDRAAAQVLRHRGADAKTVDFSPYGYDERQFCSPGFNLAVGSLTRTPHGQYPQYHTSADDLDFVRPERLADSFTAYLEVLDVLEGNRRYENLFPRGEPQLGRRGLYPSMGGPQAEIETLGLLWVLNLSDGGWSLLDIAERAGLPFDVLARAADALATHGLIKECPDPG